MCLCVYIVCVSVHVYVCGVPNIKFVSLACMPNEPKSVKCTNGIYMCLYVCVHVSLCISICVCVWYAKYKISISGILFQMSQKVQNAKNGICLCVCMCLCVSVFLCVWCAIYKLSIFGMFAK